VSEKIDGRVRELLEAPNFVAVATLIEPERVKLHGG
jgi:hypothetical protein